MTEMTPFERQVEQELEGMVGPIPRFDAIKIAEDAVGVSRRQRRWPRLLDAMGLAAAAVLLLVVGIGLAGRWLPTNDDGRLVVALDGSGDFATVAEAVAAAEDGDVVLLEPGTYRESVEVTKDIEIRGQDDGGEVIFEVASEGPAFRLRDVDATISDIAFLSRPWEGQEDRRPIIWVEGGVPTISDLVAHADEPVEFTFIRLYATAEGTIVSGNESSGTIRANRGARALIEDNVLTGPVGLEPPAGITVERDDTSLRVVRNELNFVEAFSGSVELLENDIHGGTPVNLTWDGGGELGSISYGHCGITGSDSLVMTSGRIRDTETGVCGSARILGGELHDNGVGVWSSLGFAPEPNGQDIFLTVVRDAVIRDNVVGVRTAPYSRVLLQDVTFCGNEVDTENHETSTIEESGTLRCES